MSTLRTVNIQHPSASSANITLNSNGTMGDASFSNYSGKNAIINGNFSTWQRGTSLTTLTSGQYLADRWSPNLFQSCRAQRVTNSFSGSGPRSQYAIRISSPTSAQFADGSRMVLTQPIESVNSIPLRGKVVTLSFWARFSSTTFSSTSNTGESAYDNFIPQLNFFTSTTDASVISTWPDSNSIFTIQNGSFPTSWTKYQFTTTVPNNVNNIYVRFGFNSRGSTAVADTNWYELAEVQLEEGSFPTPFENESFNVTMSKCERYYQKSYDLGVFPGTNSSAGLRGGGRTSGVSGAAVRDYCTISRMRSAPTVTIYDIAGNANRVSFDVTNNVTGSAFHISETSFAVEANSVSGDNRMYYHFSASAEL